MINNAHKDTSAALSGGTLATKTLNLALAIDLVVFQAIEERKN